MSAIVALVGHREVVNSWSGKLLGQLDTYLPPGSSYSYARNSFDIEDQSLDKAHPGSATASTGKSNLELINAKLSEIKRSHADLQLVLVPFCLTDHATDLLDPITHMLIFSRTRGCSEYEAWSDFAEDCNVTQTHRLITEEGGDRVYSQSDGGPIKVEAFVEPTDFDSESREWRKRSEVVSLLTGDLLRIAQ